jgi:AAA family ATPase
MPPIISSLKLVIEPVSSDLSNARDQRRAYISPDVLRTYKIPAGSWVVLAGSDRYAVLQLWPRVSADMEGESLNVRSEWMNADGLAVYASSTRFSSRLENIDIHLFDPSTSAKILKSVALAGPNAGEDLTTREKDWLVSHLKEELGKFP